MAFDFHMAASNGLIEMYQEVIAKYCKWSCGSLLNELYYVNILIRRHVSEQIYSQLISNVVITIWNSNSTLLFSVIVQLIIDTANDHIEPFSQIV